MNLEDLAMRASRGIAIPCVTYSDNEIAPDGIAKPDNSQTINVRDGRHSDSSAATLWSVTALSILALLYTSIAAQSTPLASGGLSKTATQSDLPPLVKKVFVFGKDDRKKLPAKYEDLKYKIGFLYSSTTNHVCTASCVAPDVILTAAHCALIARKNKKRFPDTKGLKFYLRHPLIPDVPLMTNVLNPQDITPRNMVAGSLVSRPYRGSKFRNDWAFIKLRTKSCMSGFLPLKSISRKSIAKASKTGKLVEVAFHGDRDFGKELLITDNCKIKGGKAQRQRRNRSLILHTCDLTEGASGSPLLIKSASGLSIVGLNVGGVLRRKVLKRGRKIVKRYKSRAVHNIAVDVSRFEGRLDQIKAAEPVNTESGIRQLQQGLREREFYSGEVDGLFGPGTWNAIRKFEKKNKRPVLGLPTKSILREFNAERAFRREALADIRARRGE